MLKLFSKEKPSKTAFMVAWLRAWAHKDFQDQIWGADFLAEYFLSFPIRLLIKSEKFREIGRTKSNESGPGIYEYVIARTLFFDEVFSQALKKTIPQIIVLGAGYDSRGIRFKDLNLHSRIIELDRDATQSRKIKYLKKHKIRIPDYLTFSTIDFNRQSLESCLTSAGYQKDQRSLFIWEGVSMYLETQSIKDTLTFIQQCSPSDSLLAFDYAVSFSDNDIRQYYGGKEILKSMEHDYRDEPVKNFLKDKNITDFLNMCGHRMIRHLNQDEIEKTYLKKEDGSSIGRPNGLLNFVITSPQSLA